MTGASGSSAVTAVGGPQRLLGDGGVDGTQPGLGGEIFERSLFVKRRTVVALARRQRGEPAERPERDHPAADGAAAPLV